MTEALYYWYREDLVGIEYYSVFHLVATVTSSITGLSHRFRLDIGFGKLT